MSRLCREKKKKGSKKITPERPYVSLFILKENSFSVLPSFTEGDKFQFGLKSKTSSAPHLFASLFPCCIKAIPHQLIDSFNKDQPLRGNEGRDI